MTGSEATKIFLDADCQIILQKAVPDSVRSKEQKESGGGQVVSEAAFCALFCLGIFTSTGDLNATLLDPRPSVVPRDGQLCAGTAAFLAGSHRGGSALDLPSVKNVINSVPVLFIHSSTSRTSMEHRMSETDFKDGKARLLPSRHPGLMRKACNRYFNTA